MKRIFFYFLLVLSLSACNTHPIPLAATLKLQATDPFKNTMVASQSFDVDARQDNVVEGDKGTILVLPKGCFKNAKGDVIEKNVKVELAEALTYDDMLASNLTTTSGGKPLQTDGMIYFNASADGEQLTVSKDNPVHIEIPTNDKQPDMMAYKGTRDKDGNMDWSDPKELDKYLETVDMDQLDFIPKEYEEHVDRDMSHGGFPFKNRKAITKELKDSLYYTFTHERYKNLIHEMWKLEGRGYNYNEAYYNKQEKVVNGKYTKESYVVDSNKEESTDTNILHYFDHLGIDVNAVKVLKSKRFQNSLIATREFEERMKAIHYVGDEAILDIYVKNLDKNLYELDSIAWVTIADTTRDFWQQMHKVFPDKDIDLQVFSMNQLHSEKFHQFYLQHLTKVKDGDKYAALLKDYYVRQLLKTRAESDKQLEKIEKAAAKKDKEFDKLVSDYEKVLWKREKYRMQTYNFTWTETGWINIDNGTIPKTWGSQPLEVTLTNGKDYPQVYTYVVYTTIKSLYRLNTKDNLQFYAGNDADKAMLMPKHAKAVLIAIGYKGDSSALGVKEFETSSEPKFSMQLLPSDAKSIKNTIAAYEKYKQENKISVDLEYVKELYAEKVQAANAEHENIVLQSLWKSAHPIGCDWIYTDTVNSLIRPTGASLSK